ncbi:LysR family transcriptional regulator [Paraburkholderia sp. J63]|uniref:LysR family transcriptional regulator n=1 Tax=Paraburkholderia sp. J63 TaxID=2805434 RepID=UPI002ABD3F57|nr:LysR substrate-binding domain-containing protein [Paraburkholderia sp. J63]
MRHLQLLVALDELRSVVKAANLLSISQPAVSKMLGSLESGLGVRLFDRGPNGMTPTEYGTSFLSHAREVLFQLTSAQEDLRALLEGRITRVALGVMPAAALVLVPRFIVELEASAREVAVSVREGPVEMLMPALRNGELDFLVGVLPNRPLSPEIASETLYTDPFVITVRKDHPLALREEKELDWSELRGYPVVLPPSGALTHEMILDMLARHRVSIPLRYVESLSTLTNVGVLTQSDSFALMPLEIARYFENFGALAILPIPIPDLRRNVGLMWQSRRGDRATATVLELFRTVRNLTMPQTAPEAA